MVDEERSEGGGVEGWGEWRQEEKVEGSREERAWSAGEVRSAAKHGYRFSDLLGGRGACSFCYLILIVSFISPSLPPSFPPSLPPSFSVSTEEAVSCRV